MLGKMRLRKKNRTHDSWQMIPEPSSIKHQLGKTYQANFPVIRAFEKTWNLNLLSHRKNTALEREGSIKWLMKLIPTSLASRLSWFENGQKKGVAVECKFMSRTSAQWFNTCGQCKRQ
jgi:hypothetical protein